MRKKKISKTSNTHTGTPVITGGSKISLPFATGCWSSSTPTSRVLAKIMTPMLAVNLVDCINLYSRSLMPGLVVGFSDTGSGKAGLAPDDIGGTLVPSETVSSLSCGEDMLVSVLPCPSRCGACPSTSSTP